MKQSESINELALALSQFQGEVSNITKDKQGYGYKYADLPSILDLVRPLLNKYNLCITQFPGDATGADWIALDTIIMHTSGQYMSSTFTISTAGLKGTMAQAYGAAISYARRYAISSVLGIASSDDDNDAVGSNKKPSKLPIDRLDDFLIENNIKPTADMIDAWLKYFKVPTMNGLTESMVNAIISKYKVKQNV